MVPASRPVPSPLLLIPHLDLLHKLGVDRLGQVRLHGLESKDILAVKVGGRQAVALGVLGELDGAAGPVDGREQSADPGGLHLELLNFGGQGGQRWIGANGLGVREPQTQKTARSSKEQQQCGAPAKKTRQF